MRATALLHEAGGLVRFSHTVFALPFAVMAAFAAARGLPPPPVLAWILAAMVGARTAAMAFNRLADHAIDARNPRTAGRHLPSARVSRRFAWTLVGAGAALLWGMQHEVFRIRPQWGRLPDPSEFLSGVAENVGADRGA